MVERKIHRDRKYASGCQGLKEDCELGMTTNGYKACCRGAKSILELG